MKILYVGGAVALIAASAALPGQAPAAPAPAQCAELIGQYRSDIDTASRYKALNAALGEDASASQRAAETNAMASAKLNLEALKAAGCKVTVLAPSPKPYMPAANRCKLDSVMSRFGQGDAATCEPKRWVAAK